ncbi:hypothetical protein DIPPA_33018 [Diplonema papillatum]|nr:hypothetical protein DIPPA_33018 [Diplonema papillatum]
MNFDAAEPGEAAHRKDSEEEGFIGGDYEYAKAARKRLWGKAETVDNFSDRNDGLSAGGSEPPQTTGNTEEDSDAADVDLRMNEPAGADARVITLYHLVHNK